MYLRSAALLSLLLALTGCRELGKAFDDVIRTMIIVAAVFVFVVGLVVLVFLTYLARQWWAVLHKRREVTFGLIAATLLLPAYLASGYVIEILNRVDREEEIRQALAAANLAKEKAAQESALREQELAQTLANKEAREQARVGWRDTNSRGREVFRIDLFGNYIEAHSSTPCPVLQRRALDVPSWPHSFPWLQNVRQVEGSQTFTLRAAKRSLSLALATTSVDTTTTITFGDLLPTLALRPEGEGCALRLHDPWHQPFLVTPSSQNHRVILVQTLRGLVGAIAGDDRVDEVFDLSDWTLDDLYVFDPRGERPTLLLRRRLVSPDLWDRLIAVDAYSESVSTVRGAKSTGQGTTYTWKVLGHQATFDTALTYHRGTPRVLEERVIKGGAGGWRWELRPRGHQVELSLIFDLELPTTPARDAPEREAWSLLAAFTLFDALAQ